jgi:predicted amidophosphoribosyltransferase
MLDDLVAALPAARYDGNVLSLGASRGELRRAIHHMKYRNARWIAAYLGKALASAHSAAVDAAHSTVARGDSFRPQLVTWAPTTSRRIRARGHDQCGVIASAFARSLRVRCARTLRRLDHNTQTGSNRESRKLGPQFVARARMVRGRTIVLIDDVTTTGTTLVRARDALLAAGALEVRCAVIAHVRARHPSRVG